MLFNLTAKITKTDELIGYILSYQGSRLNLLRETAIQRKEDITGVHIYNNELLLNNGRTWALPCMDYTDDWSYSKIETIVVSLNERIYTSGSKGNQSKWVQGNKWIKADTQGYEGLAEEISSLLLSCIYDVAYVPYRICNIVDEDGKAYKGCYSLSMYDQFKKFIPVYSLFEQNGIDLDSILEKLPTQDRIAYVITEVKRFCNIDITKYIYDNLYLDQLIYNEDRHFNNLGVLQCKKTNRYYTAPIFDNGMGFLARQEQWGNIPVFSAVRSIKYEPFGNKQIKALQSLNKDYILHINYDKVIKIFSNYSNGIYEEKFVSQCKKLLTDNLERTEGRLWIRR